MKRLFVTGVVIAAFGAGASGASAEQPCEGCAGEADNKNPPGQLVGDRNAGYEADRNSGVGNGNPAHSAPAAP